MTVASDNRPWIRLLDGDMFVVPEQPVQRLYPKDLDEVVQCVNLAINPPLGASPQARAIGSHWAISKTGVTIGFMIETSTPVHEQPSGDQAHRLNKVLYDVIPECLTPQAYRFFLSQDVPSFNPLAAPTGSEIYLFHVQAGMRIYELYSALDKGDVAVGKVISLGDHVREDTKGSAPPSHDYSGPWALETMGGAGGQTIVGAFSTGTHGGDLGFGPIADAVLAVHFIGADGRQYWFERTRLRPTTVPLKLIDDVKLGIRFPGIIYRANDDLLNAVTVACGRMGVIYAVVLRVVRQFALKESYFSSRWDLVKEWIFGGPGFPGTAHFVKVDVNPYGSFWHKDVKDCYVTTREMVKLADAGAPPWGRKERTGDNAGNSHSIDFDGPGFFENACAADDWIRAALDEIESELETIRDAAITAWGVAAAVIAFDPLPSDKAAAVVAQQAAQDTIAWSEGLILTCDFLTANVIPDKLGFGDTLAALTNFMADNDLFPLLRWIYQIVAKKKHGDSSKPKTAISYAIMDEHDYLDRGCIAPGDSIEIFFDGTSGYLPAFIDRVLERVDQMADGNLANGEPAIFGGYISMRFMAQAQALIGMQKWSRTCSIEIAGLAHVKGVEPLLQQVEADAVEFNAVLHWGQRNNWTQKAVERVHNPVGPFGGLYKWRDALSFVTEHGRYPVFSTEFSRRVGLEITTPIVQSFWVQPTDGCASEQATVTWEAISNPPETQAYLVITPEKGNPTRLSLPGLNGTTSVALGPGRSIFALVLERELNGRIYRDKRELPVRGYTEGDEYMFSIETEAHYVDGKVRWTADINLFSVYISDSIRVDEIDCTLPGGSDWWVRNAEIGDVKFTPALTHRPTPSRPVFNKRWLFFSDATATGAAPTLQVVFKLSC
jgi:hypothetical protein